MPQAFKRGVAEARGETEGLLGYSPEGISKTWKVHAIYSMLIVRWAEMGSWGKITDYHYFITQSSILHKHDFGALRNSRHNQKRSAAGTIELLQCV